MNNKLNKCMIIVPHEDDEFLVGNKLLLELSKDVTYSIYVVFMTNGDYFSHEKNIRLNESINGLSSIGVPQDNIFSGV